MKNTFLLSFGILFLTLINSCTGNSQIQGVKNIKQAEFQKLAKDPNTVIIDVRTPGEVSEGYIDGATLFIEASKGFKKLYNLEGGISNWTGTIKK
jgi:rhodanese-related sulfurtransferase